MKDQKILTTSLFFKLSKEASYEFSFPLYLSIIFQTISYFQIISSIIKATFPDAINSLDVVNFLKKIFVATSIFGELDIFSYSTTSEVIWIILAVYNCIQTLLLVGALALVILDIRKEVIFKVVSLTLTVHSRILFYPIHYFYLQIIGFFTYDSHHGNSFFRNDGVLGITIFLAVINLLVSCLKEIWFYRVTKSKNTYASHSNLSCQLVLFQKALIPIILLVPKPTTTTSTAIAIISILFTILQSYNLYSKLPFYNYNLMKYTYFLSVLIFPFSIIGLFNTFLSGNDVLETLLVVGAAISAKASMIILDNQFEKILAGDVSTPAKAIYYVILMKKFTSKSAGLMLSEKKFKIESIYYYSTFDPKLDEQKNLKDRKMSRLRKQEFYAGVIEKLLNSRVPYQKSAILMLYMARIFMKKLENASRALNLIQKVLVINCSMPVRNSIESFKTSLQDAYLKAFSYTNDELELSNYFIYRKEFSILKESMQNEIKLHLDFWQELSGDDAKVKKVVDLANQIDAVYLKIKDRWNKNSHKFATVYPSSLLMYGLYLDTIRGLPQESIQTIQKFYNYNKNGDYKKAGALTEQSAIVIASVEKDKMGQVVDASNTVESLFGISKERLIGEKVNFLMPAFLAKNHDDWMERYCRSSTNKGINKRIVSFGKKMDGTLLNLEIDLKLYPYLDKGVNLMGYLRQKSEEEKAFIVKPEGTVAECSPKLLDVLNGFGINLNTINILEACHNFSKINTAFNIVYSTKEDTKPKEEVDTTGNNLKFDDITFTRENNYTIQNTYNYTNLETLTDGVYAQRNKTEDVSLFNSNHNNNTEINRYETLKNTITVHSSHTKSRFHTMEFKSMQFPRSHTTLNEEQALEICQTFEASGCLKFKLKETKGSPKKKNKVLLDVTIEPYKVQDSVYKVIKVLDVQADDGLSTESSFEARKKLIPLLEKSEQLEQLSGLESSLPSPSQGSAPGASDIPNEKSFIYGGIVEDASVSIDRKKSFVKKRVSIVNPSESKFKKKIQSFAQIDNKDELDNLDIRQSIGRGASSTKSRSQMDQKIIKTLHDFFGEQNVRLVTRVSIYGVYLIMAGILALAFINYAFTQRSLTEIDNGVEIVDLVSRRLTSSLRAWQWMILIYSRLVGLRSRSSIAYLLSIYLEQEGTNMRTLNNELRSQISLIGSPEIIDEIFSTRTRFYDPITKKTLTNGNLDVFTANNILSQCNIVIGSSTANDSVLLGMSEPLMSINNTANDFLISSETQITEIIGGLQLIISKNVNLLVTILGFENMALALLVIGLIIVARVVIRSYSRTFTALARITTESIAERIYKIKKFQTSLNENIEAKSFLTNLNLYLEFYEENKLDRKLIKDKDKKQRFFNKRYTIKELVWYIVQYLAVSFIFILIISGLFAVLYIQSTNSFDTLSGISEQLSVTSSLSYQSSLLLSNFYFMLIFQNRTDMKIRNEAPDVQLDKNMYTFGNVNDELLRTLFYNGKSDPIIESFLQNDICSYISSDLKDTCLNSTQGGSLGLLSFNLKYYKTSSYYLEIFQNNRTLEGTKYVVAAYFNDVTLDISVLDGAYTFLTDYILAGFNTEVNDLESLNLVLSMGSVGFIALATFMIQKITIKTLISLDHSRKKIFRTLTYYVFSQNKSVGFLLKQEFGNEIEGLNRILYV